MGGGGEEGVHVEELFAIHIAGGDGACQAVDGRMDCTNSSASWLQQVFCGMELNYPFSTRGAGRDLFLLHSPAPPSAAHSGIRGQGQLCGYSAFSAECELSRGIGRAGLDRTRSGAEPVFKVDFFFTAQPNEQKQVFLLLPWSLHIPGY